MDQSDSELIGAYEAALLVKAYKCNIGTVLVGVSDIYGLGV